jgi:hypothetical protein
MFELVLADIIKLIPESFRDGKQTDGNIYKIIKVIVEEFNKDMVTLEDVFNMSLVSGLTGVQLDLYGAGFGLVRGDKTDAEFLLEIIAFEAQTVIGNDVDSILSLFRLITGDTGLNVRIKEKFDSDLDNPRPRAFDIILDNQGTTEALALLPIAQTVKAAGVDVTIDELATDSFLTQGNGDYLLQGNGGKIIIEPGNLP